MIHELRNDSGLICKKTVPSRPDGNSVSDTTPTDLSFLLWPCRPDNDTRARAKGAVSAGRLDSTETSVGRAEKRSSLRSVISHCDTCPAATVTSAGLVGLTIGVDYALGLCAEDPIRVSHLSPLTLSSRNFLTERTRLRRRAGSSSAVETPAAFPGSPSGSALPGFRGEPRRIARSGPPQCECS